ncbi:hypothetical protein B0H13DRAFT_1884807 [Mycena leptocephala]|nr:hypothetical protein B0H13DRAFT_1884807 [Mycena leptocephala]
MCEISTSIIFWALSPIPGFRYIGLGLVVTSFIIYAANRQRPSYKLSQLEDMIKIVEEMLKRAREKCARDHVELTNEARCLLEAKLSASKIQSRLLKTRNDTTWKKYLQSLRGIMQSIDECAKKVKKIQTSTLLTIQTEHQRQLSEGIKEFREVADAVVCSSTREGRTQTTTRRRRFEFERMANVLDESYMVTPTLNCGVFSQTMKERGSFRDPIISTEGIRWDTLYIDLKDVVVTRRSFKVEVNSNYGWRRKITNLNNYLLLEAGIEHYHMTTVESDWASHCIAHAGLELSSQYGVVYENNPAQISCGQKTKFEATCPRLRPTVVKA